MAQQQDIPQPPQPPQMERKIQLYPYQWIGVPLLFLLPVLALVGLFGERLTAVSAANEAVRLQVEYPARSRYRINEPLIIEVTNLTGQGPITMTVTISRAYIEQFSSVTFTPQPNEITPEAYVVEVVNVPAGGARYVSVELQAERYWRHTADISAFVEGAAPVQTSISTWVFP